MKLRQTSVAAGIFVAVVLGLAHPTAAQECRQLTIHDTPPLDRIRIGSLGAANEKGTKYAGSASLFLEDGTEIFIEAHRKLREKQGTWKYKLKTPKKANPKVKVNAELGGDPEGVLKFKLTYKPKGEKKTKLKDPSRVTLGDCPSSETSFIVGLAGGTFDAADGKVTLYFRFGAVAEDTTITVAPATPPAGTDFLPGTLYRFEPSMPFLQPVDLTITYDPAAVSGDENDLVLANLLEGGSEEEIERLCERGHVDTVNHRVTGFIHGFSRYAPAAPIPLRGATHFDAEVQTDQSVRLAWVADEAINVLIERAQVSSGGPCPYPEHPSCMGGAMNGLQFPSEADFAAGSTLRIPSATHIWTGPTTIGRPGVYYYRIRTSDGTRQSPPSALRRVVIFGPKQAPPDPVYVRASAYACGGIYLTWDHVFEAEYYMVSRREAGQPENTFLILDWPLATDLFYVDTSPLTPATDYVYRIQAANSAGWSPGAVRDTATSSSAEYIAKLADDAPVVAPGDSVEIDLDLDWIVTPYDVTPGVSTDSPRVTGQFNPATTNNGSRLTLTVDPATPNGLRVAVEVTVTPGDGTPCPIPVVNLTVQDPNAALEVTLTRLYPESSPPGSETTVTLTGTGFVAGSQVTLDGEPVESSFVRDTELVAYLPKMKGGIYLMRVENPDRAQSRALRFVVD